MKLLSKKGIGLLKKLLDSKLNPHNLKIMRNTTMKIIMRNTTIKNIMGSTTKKRTLMKRKKKKKKEVKRKRTRKIRRSELKVS